MIIWWIIMVLIGTVNIILLAIFLAKKKAASLYVKIFAGIFLCVALYRSIFPSSYPNLLAWFDTGFNSPFLIRCLALFAELSFIGIIALALKNYCKENNIKGFLAYSPIISVCCIAAAQPFAFAGLITQYLWPFAIEETLWALAFVAIAPLCFAGFKNNFKKNGYYKIFFSVMSLWCIGYFLFQAYSLPFTYYLNLAEDIGKTAGTLKQAISGYTATRDFTIWGGLPFFIWCTGYFSVCSWMVLMSACAPVKK